MCFFNLDEPESDGGPDTDPEIDYGDDNVGSSSDSDVDFLSHFCFALFINHWCLWQNFNWIGFYYSSNVQIKCVAVDLCRIIKNTFVGPCYVLKNIQIFNIN